MNIKFKIKKGDEVIVLAGKDKGKKGKIVKLLPKLNKAIRAASIGASTGVNW